MQRQSVFVGNKQQKNPLTTSPGSLADGKEAFSHYCVACHGMDGQNTGVPFADKMSPPVPSLASSEVQSYTDGQLKWVIDNGIWPSGMPGSKGTLTKMRSGRSLFICDTFHPPAASVNRKCTVIESL